MASEKALVILRSRGGRMGVRVLDVQPTPNPDAAKFILDRRIAEQPTSFFSSESADGHPIAKQLFEIPGVSSLLFLGDFVTVNKSPQAAWSRVTPAVRKVLEGISE
jgi:NFU1 iron-sulfur cluster scaffold homolog, mitochondrial